MRSDPTSKLYTTKHVVYNSDSEESSEEEEEEEEEVETKKKPRKGVSEEGEMFCHGIRSYLCH